LKFSTNRLVEKLSTNIPIIGDGGYVFALEKRGFMKAYPWTPEVVIEHPEAVKQLHREFVHCGSDVIQTFTFFSAEDNISTGGSGGQSEENKLEYSWKDINYAACNIAHEIKKE